MALTNTRRGQFEGRPMDRYKLAKRWLFVINLAIASIAGAGAFVANHAPSSSQWLFEMVDAARVFLPLDSWVSKSNFPRAAQVYDLLALPLVVTSTAWFFALLYLRRRDRWACHTSPRNA